jgi:hypothetical protein
VGVATVAGMTTKARQASRGFAAVVSVLLSATLVVALMGGSADAAGLIAKDGKIHACYKWKGKRKGALKVVRGAKVRCPRRWKKIAWHASPRPGPKGETGATGAPGERGPTGTAGNVAVEELEDTVSELQAKLEALEAVLNGTTSQQLSAAVGAVPAVESLCAQTEALTDQSNSLGGSMEALNTTLSTLVALFSPVTLPSALPSYGCPTS